MSSGYTVTIMGGTGLLGQHISEIFLTEFRSSFPIVKVLTRDPTSAKARALKDKGAELFHFDEKDLARALDDAFAGADVIVNALPMAEVDPDVVARSNAKVYFASEFGSDHRGYDHPTLRAKEHMAAQVRSVAKGKKVIAMFTSGFPEFMFHYPFFCDLPKNTFTVYGSSKQKFTLTSTRDIGRAVAQTSILCLDPATAAKVPDEIFIAGETVSIEEVRDAVARVKNIEKGEIVSKDLGELQASLQQKRDKKEEASLWDYLYMIFGEGKADFSLRNDNELINPGEKLWKWVTVEEYLRSI